MRHSYRRKAVARLFLAIDPILDYADRRLAADDQFQDAVNESSSRASLHVRLLFLAYEGRTRFYPVSRPAMETMPGSVG
jgi:hypothetical protein